MKIQVEVTIWYKENSNKQVEYFISQVTEYPDDGFGLIKPEFKVDEGKTEDEICTFYTKNEEGKSVKLPQEVKEKIMYPGKEWEGTPLLTIKHNDDEYEVLCCHIDGY